jgi:biopolymer transport protein ExbD
MKKRIFRLFLVGAAVLAIIFAESAQAKECNLPEYYVDIYQGKKPDESRVVISIGKQENTLIVKGDLEDENIQRKMKQWAQNLARDYCNRSL